jgi:DNA-binding MarR family transcriptional regulator
MPVSNQDVAAVQRAYPKIYLACHTRHERRRSNAAQLTAHESSLLAHLSATTPMRASELARHLDVTPSTMSAAIKRLAAAGYIASTRDPEDARALALRLSSKGAKAMQAGSVLDSALVRRLLAVMSADDRTRAIAGLELLAAAADTLSRKRGGAR